MPDWTAAQGITRRTVPTPRTAPGGNNDWTRHVDSVFNWSATQGDTHAGAPGAISPIQVWNGSGWVARPLLRWNGSQWVPR